MLRKPLRAAVAAGHPWIWRDATTGSEHAPGTVVTVVDAKGKFVGRGLAEDGPIAVRVWTADDEPVGPEMLARRVASALSLRQRVVPPETTAWRLLHGEGDRVPGIVCDVYGDVASIALDGAAALAWHDQALEALRPVLDRIGVASAMVRSGRRGQRQVEHVWGPVPPEPLTVLECGTKLVLSVVHGQKTGMFLDHRTARAAIRSLCRDARVLDLYSYVGGFSANAGRGGARSVDTVDVAPEAVTAARAAWAANGLPIDRQTTHVADVPEFLAAAHAAKRQWDVIIADPPSFAPNESSKENALRAYAMLHAACAKVLVRGGLLLAASCSSHVDSKSFEDALSLGSARARRIVQVLDRWGAPPDHPRLLAFPEGDYLKVVLARLL